MTRGRVFVVSSPSGGGKTTVVKLLRRRFPKLLRSVSVTTRKRRKGERNFRDYFFVDETEFAALRRKRELLEWVKVHGAHYGTPRRPILDAIAAGRDVVVCIDVQGARKIRKALGRQAVLIFLVPPSLEALEVRLQRRSTETAEDIRRRMITAKQELACASWYDYQVTNDQVQHAVAQLGAIIRRTADASARLRKRGEGWRKSRSTS